MTTYDQMRHLADSWGLVATMLLFFVLVGWSFRKGARAHHEHAANIIFAEDDDNALDQESKRNG
ncbi:MAG: cbb3-type cytochrome c oxidase subunit 3 [Sphingomonadaceae bacterium]